AVHTIVKTRAGNTKILTFINKIVIQYIVGNSINIIENMVFIGEKIVQNSTHSGDVGHIINTFNINFRLYFH
ncbi:MAG: hypothetical protein K2H28_01815, partial [Ruminococcus sp.]|nr:hypothetical protein [Ruminococcus sp.]